MKKLLFIFLLIPTILFSQTNNITLKTHADKEFSIKYPSNWELNSEGKMTTSFILFAPLESAQDKFKENINLIIQDLSGYTIDLEAYTAISEQQLKNAVVNFKLVESKQIKNEKDTYHHIIYEGEQAGFKLHFYQQYRVKNNKAYVLTFTAELQSVKRFSEVATKILNSFQLK
jgi:serine/threonine-protein kinase